MAGFCETLGSRTKVLVAMTAQSVKWWTTG